MQPVSTNQRLPKFIVAAVLFFAWGVIQGAIMAQKPVHDFIAQGPAGIIGGAHVHINLLGWVSLMTAAMAYYLVPALTGKSIAGPRLMDAVFWVWTPVTALMGVLMIGAGISGGNAFIAGTKGPQLDAVLAPFMIPISLLGIVGGVIMAVFVIQILVSLLRKSA